MAVNNLSMQGVGAIGGNSLGLRASFLAAARRITTAAFQEAGTDQRYRQ